MTKPAEQRCRQCGCTNDRACALALGDRCYWVMPDLCSNPSCLFADPRTPPLDLFRTDFGDTCRRLSTAIVCLLRPLGGDEAIPAIGDPNNSLRSATPSPGPLMQPLLERLPLQWLLRLVFLDPGVNAVEVHPWIRSTSHLDRAVNRVGGLRLCRRRGRVFVRRWAPESKGGSK